LLAVGLMLAWKIAGSYGADRVLLPLVGTPWHGVDVQETKPPAPIGSASPRAAIGGSGILTTTGGSSSSSSC
jgi:hypothetical protein